jgi:prophage tail gpP-like protein
MGGVMTLDDVSITASAPGPVSPAGNAGGDDLTLRVNGALLAGWKTFSVTRGIELLPSIAQMTFSEVDPTLVGVAPVAPFSPIVAYLGADKILDGYVDVYAPEIEAARHLVTAACRSKCEDIVDCSVDVEALASATGTWQISAGTIGQAARRLVAPYGISVVLPDDDPPLNPQYPIAVQPGMTVYHVIEELARMTQMLVWDDANGALVISRVGTKRAANALFEGQDIKVGAARLSGDQRYARVMAIGQYFFSDINGPHLSFKATATDTQVPRPRLLIVPIDLPGPDGKWVTQRAQWEVARRLGRSRAVRIVTPGWRDVAGTLWQPNTVVNINSPSLKISEDMLISEVTWARSEAGTTSTLLCAPPQAFSIAPFTFKPLITTDPATGA